MRYPKRRINVKVIRKHLSYDPATGYFTSLKPSPTGRIPAGFVYKPLAWDSYMHLRINGVQYKAHRVAWVLMTGKQPDVIDHINGLRHDNRFVNLRDGTHSQNLLNRKKHRKAKGTYVDHPDAYFQPN